MSPDLLTGAERFALQRDGFPATETAYARVARARGWLPAVRVLHRYADGAVRATLNGVEITVGANGSIGWAQSWEFIFDVAGPAGWTVDRCYGPSTYNHTTVFLAPAVLAQVRA